MTTVLQPPEFQATTAGRRRAGRDRVALALFWTLILAAAARALWLACADYRLTLGTSMPSDLVHVLEYHASIRGWLPRGLAELVASHGLKPPLYYGGTALLFAPFDHMPRWGLAAINAVALALIADILRREMSRHQPASLALLGVVAFLSLRGVLGLVSRPGSEFVHAALLAALVTRLSALLRGDVRRAGLSLGLLVGAGLLVRWSFVAYALPPMLTALGIAIARSSRESGRARQESKSIAAGGLIGLALFLPWLLAVASGEQARAVLASEPVGQPGLLGGLAFYLREGAVRFLGAQAAPVGLVLFASLLTKRSRLDTAAWLHVAAMLGVLLPHAAIAHREARYLLLLAPSAVFVAVTSAEGAWRRGLAWRATLGACVCLLPLSLLWMPGIGARSGAASVAGSIGDLVFWPVPDEQRAEWFFEPVEQQADLHPCAVVAPSGSAGDSVFVWVAGNLLARGLWPMMVEEGTPSASVPGASASCPWLVENGGGAGTAALASAGWTLEREVVLESAFLDQGTRIFRIWRRESLP